MWHLMWSFERSSMQMQSSTHNSFWWPIRLYGIACCEPPHSSAPAPNLCLIPRRHKLTGFFFKNFTLVFSWENHFKYFLCLISLVLIQAAIIPITSWKESHLITFDLFTQLKKTNSMPFNAMLIIPLLWSKQKWSYKIDCWAQFFLAGVLIFNGHTHYGAARAM